MASILHARGLVDDATVDLWPSWDKGADELGLPRAYIVPMAASEYVDTFPSTHPPLMPFRFHLPFDSRN
jgi:hypothetical protein